MVVGSGHRWFWLGPGPEGRAPGEAGGVLRSVACLPQKPSFFKDVFFMGSVVFGVFHFLLRTAARQKLCVVSVREGKLPARAGRAASVPLCPSPGAGSLRLASRHPLSQWLLLFAVVPKGPVIFLQLTVSWFILQFCCPIFHFFLVVITSNAVLGSSARGF